MSVEIVSFQQLLDEGHPDIDAACISTASRHGHDKDTALSCKWIDGKIEKTVGCEDCPFVEMSKKRKSKC